MLNIQYIRNGQASFANKQTNTDVCMTEVGREEHSLRKRYHGKVCEYNTNKMVRTVKKLGEIRSGNTRLCCLVLCWFRSGHVRLRKLGLAKLDQAGLDPV